MTSPEAGPTTPATRSVFRRVAVPSEHGGWALTAEPVLLGLLVAPSVAGVALALAAFVAFLVRTPVTVVLVDRHRERWLHRTTIAARVAVLEGVVVVVLVAVALLTGSARWLLLLAIAVPLVAVELDFDLRSRSRRLLPELCGAVGMSAVVACIVLAAGEPAELAVALWLIAGGRSVASIPFARTQIERLHERPVRFLVSDVAQVAGVALAVVATVLERSVLPGLVALGVLAAVQVVMLRRKPVPAVLLGIGQSVAGLVIVLVTAAGVRW
jgi:hypothetical protein